MLVQSNGGVIAEMKTVWYAGTDVLQEGYALCFDVAASATDPIVKQRLGQQVVKPATANLNAFAGLVDANSAGKTGPCFVDILVPRTGDFVTAWTNLNQTAFTSKLGPVNASYALGAIAAPAALANVQDVVAETVAVSAQTVDTSGTAAAALVRYL